jgi:DNA mismatch repair protein MutS2
LTPTAPAKTRADLEVDRVLSAIAERCASERGRALALTLPLLDDRADVLRSLAEIDEVRRLDDLGTPPPRQAVPEVEEALARARVGASLSGPEVLSIGQLLTAGRTLRKFLRAHRDDAPALASACESDPSLDDLGAEICRSIEPDGTVSDAASPRLAELRSERRASRERIVRRLEEMVARYGPILSDSYWTERDGRYVLPVRSDAHERFPGIVHGASAAGATLFVEPRTVVSMGNRHKVLDAAVQREEEIVLARLSALVGESADAILALADALAHADLRGAEARLAHELKWTTPEIPERASAADVRVALVRARHPLLALDGVEVVPSDLAMRAGRALVVSGPNAGGKTVALKTMGLAAVMVRMGLPAPAAEGSVVALFDVVLTDVGDDQSLAKNLSTFSAHVRNLAQILERTHEGALVLLDEVASGTDPREGEALATAILESLAMRGGAVACTTHYEGLKMLALSDDRFENASVGFDLDTMSPTFKVLMGVPGPSSAFAVARMFGVPGPIVARAEEVVGERAITVSKVVEDLATERRALERAREEIEHETAALRDKQRELDAEIERATSRDRGAVNREAEALMAAIKRAREELRAAQARLRGPALDQRALSDASRAIDKAASTVSIGGPLAAAHAKGTPEPPSVSAADVFPGMKVFVPRLRTDAEVIEVLGSGQIRVAAGPLKLLVSIDEVRGAKKPAQAKPRPDKRAAVRSFDPAADPDMPIQTSDNTVDLRGLRAHEAVAVAEQFLDRCVGAELRVAFLIHGHGTGALRQVLRDALKTSPYVERLRPGEPREGGDGVTVVWLK